ncbi:hypothetical protein GGP51_002194 [Salinibacter ruber]|uniref:hypothetical protein n=1 Tax=Salinibacter ruber TaxID=146919 RepID=UPI002166DF2A|nr:hypothetical protein [Salinibacter ruber]MCS4190711.1 hypothetical protein [Salinibacter ruber]
MQTVRDIRRRATGDLRRRIFRSGIFQHQRMKDVARSLAREYASGLSPEKLLALARHDTWLKSGRGGSLSSQYPGEKVQCIAEELLCYLRHELRLVVDTFWDGGTSVEMSVKRSRVVLAGFFNGKRPNRNGATEGIHNDAQSLQHASYA